MWGSLLAAHPCPSGWSILGVTTVPHLDSDNGLGRATVAINVALVLVPTLVPVAFCLNILRIAFASENCYLSRSHLRSKLRACQGSVKYLIFSLIIWLLDWQRVLLHSSRPKTSCLGGSGMPDPAATWAAGLLVLRLLDLMLACSTSFLTGERTPEPTQETSAPATPAAQVDRVSELYSRERERTVRPSLNRAKSVPVATAARVAAPKGRPRPQSKQAPRPRHTFAPAPPAAEPAAEPANSAPYYTDLEFLQLGYTPMTVLGLFRELFFAVLFVGPVGLARVVLGDATFLQVALGSVEGVLVAFAFHVLYVALYLDRGERLEMRFVIAMLFGGHLCTLLIKHPLEGIADLPHRVKAARERVLADLQAGAVAEDLEQPLLPKPSEPVRMRRVRQNWRTPSCLPGLEFLRATNGLAILAPAEVQESQSGMTCTPTDELEGILAHRIVPKRRTHQVLAKLKLENDELNEQMRVLEEAKEQTRKDIAALSDEREMLQLQKAELYDAVRDLRREGIRRTLKSAVQEARGRANVEKLESSLHLEEQKIADIISFSEVLNGLQEARGNGDRRRLKEALQSENIQSLTGHNSSGQSLDRTISAPLMDVQCLKHNLGAPLAKDSEKMLQQWNIRLKHLHEALNACKAAESSTNREKAQQLAQRVFGTFVSAVDAGLNLNLEDGDRELVERIEAWLVSWQERFATNHRKHEECRNVQTLIISKAMRASKKELWNFDFTDLDNCLEMVDRAPADSKLFLSCALRQVEKNRVGGFVHSLSQLSQLVFFLEFLAKEDIAETCRKFQEKLAGMQTGSSLAGLVAEAVEHYGASAGVLGSIDRTSVWQEPQAVIAQMRQAPAEVVGQPFHDIFCQLAQAWLDEYGILAVPHHTQVVALLVFKLFLQHDLEDVQTLIAQVSTGEGKSMLIAVLAVYLVLAKGMRVHVVGGDEKLTLRDFENFRGLFHWAYGEFRGAKPSTPQQFAVACGKAQQPRDDVYSRIPADAWIVYCEAKHVTWHYTHLARTSMDFDAYQRTVLVIDEVDALVVDSDATDEIVYNVACRPIGEGHEDLSIGKYATAVGSSLLQQRAHAELTPNDPSDPRSGVYARMQELCKMVEEWRSKDLVEQDQEYQRSVETDMYTRVEGGKLDPDFKSNFLECLRLSDCPTQYEMDWYERLFVVSKPRIFSKYHRILGFSGTIGNYEERRFLTEAYRAEFFVVPPFLETCKSDRPGETFFHTAEWAKVEVAGSSQLAMYEPLLSPALVAADETLQREAIKDLVFRVREHVPVLVITESPAQAESLVDQLRKHVRLSLAGADPTDIVRSLSQREYEQRPANYKANLRACTRPLTERGGDDRKWRITVTDPTGARGTDYQMMDEGANLLGGLMLVMSHVPTSERDWVQYKGRTARQKWRGQYCVVLDAQRQAGLQSGHGGDGLAGNLHVAGAGMPKTLAEARSAAAGQHWYWVPQSGDELVQSILSFGTRESKAKLDACETVYKAGYLANEVCELVWAEHAEILPGSTDKRCQLSLTGEVRTAFREMCEGYRYMTADQICAVSGVATREGVLQPPQEMRKYVPFAGEVGEAGPKKILFMIDVSYSMKSSTRPGETRLDLCKRRMVEILTNPKIVQPADSVGVVAFSSRAETAVELQRATQQQQDMVQALAEGALIEELLQKLGGGTALYASVLASANDLLNSEGANSSSLWLIVLTDGEDSTGASPEPCRQFFRQHGSKVNLIAIAVGEKCEVLGELCNIVKEHGAVGEFVSTAKSDTASLTQAFQVVEKCIKHETGGRVEAD